METGWKLSLTVYLILILHTFYDQLMDQHLNHLIKDTKEGLIRRNVAQGQSEEVENSQEVTLVAKRLWKLFQRHGSFCWQQ